jgi:2-keto-3-deoxy-galactonokinase
MADGRRWLESRGLAAAVTLIGAPAMMGAYNVVAGIWGVACDSLDSAEVLPAALLAIAREAGLLTAPSERSLRK